MNVINQYSSINNKQVSVPCSTVKENTIKTTEYKPDVLDILSEKVVKRKDITDTVTVPRAIFKGYLCFTAGTAINAIAGMLKDKGFSKYLGIAGSLVSIYGTYNFVKPFLIKDKENK
ncbi:hypothetical protein IJ182_05335 [bacterium]|nr:hypothetical protein [bacterium]